MVRKASIFARADSYQRFQQTLNIKTKKHSLYKAFSGLLMAMLAMIALIVDPVPHFVKYYTKLTEGSYSYKLWENPPVSAFCHFYIFNVTNSKEFLSGADKKLKVNEVGPYVYKEVRWNKNMSLNENGTLTMYPKIELQYIPEKSVGDLHNDVIIAPNIPLLAISSMVADHGFFTNFALATLIRSLGEKEFLSLKVEDYLWGYESKMVKMASTILPGWITFDKFGLLTEAYKDTHDVITINVKEGKDQFAIQYWNGSPGLSEYGYTDMNSSLPCNRLKGMYEGIIFPPNVEKTNSYYIYRKSSCRPGKMVFEKEVTTSDGVRGYKFKLPDDAFDCASEENKCFCSHPWKYFPRGLTDMSPCYFDVPVASSMPHFYNEDPSIAERIEGLNPVREKHEPYVILQPDLGLPMRIKSRMQGNVVMQELTYNGPAKPFSKMVIPAFWVDLAMDELPTFMNLLVRICYVYLPIVQPIILSLILILGVTIATMNGLKFMKPQQLVKNIRMSMQYNTIPDYDEIEDKNKYVHDNPLMDTFDSVML